MSTQADSPQTYRAAVVRQFGPPENISIENLPVPTQLPAGAALVAVRTAGVNPVDGRIRSGSFGGSVPHVPGSEFAGRVVAVAPGVTEVSVGDDVLGFGTPAAQADLVLGTAAQLARKPAGVSWELAGGLSGVGQSAVTAIDRINPQAGDRVVVHGASGGVGTVLVQLLAARGVTVIGTAGPANQEYLTGLGATAVVYGDGVAERIAAAAGGPVAASIDLAGTTEAGDYARGVLAAGGQAITLVPETAQSHRIELVRTARSLAGLQRLLAAVEAGELTLPVETLPLADIVDAHRRIDAKHVRGKLILDFADNSFFPAAQS